jgi:hypothetical protein
MKKFIDSLSITAENLMKGLTLEAFLGKKLVSKSPPWKIILLIFIFNLAGSFVFGVIGWASAENQNGRYEIFVTKAITNRKILPTTYPVPGKLNGEITLRACRGEYQAASFVVHARQSISGLQADPAPLQGVRSAIAARAVDIRAVKCWYQAGTAVEDVSHTVLTPELLLKDDKLVMVDLAARKNYLRPAPASGKSSPLTSNPLQGYVCISDKSSENLANIQPQDTQRLQPVDIYANSNKQFWVTVHVPEDTLPGIYRGVIKLHAVNAPAREIPVNLTVLPFTLEKASLIYSIYYIGKPSSIGQIGQTWKSSTQYLAEMKDLLAHGVLYPTLGDSDATAPKALDLRKQAGLPVGPLFNIGIQTGNPTSRTQLNALKAKVQKRLNLARPYGYTDIYFYGMDEASGAVLASQRPAWQAVRDAGGKIFVATADFQFVEQGMKEYDTFGLVGDLLDCAVEGGPLNALVAQKYHKIRHLVFSYSNPQAGVEEPETYRRNYGLALWKAGYDGAMNCAYQLEFGNIWNDFDSPKYRDHVFAYPTKDGVIDTIQWEGFRQGVDDVRYLTTLLKAITQAKATKPALAAAAQKWVAGLNPRGDLDQLRTQMIDLVLKLQYNN